MTTTEKLLIEIAKLEQALKDIVDRAGDESSSDSQTINACAKIAENALYGVNL